MEDGPAYSTRRRLHEASAAREAEADELQLIPSMFTSDDLARCYGDPIAITNFFIDRKLILPFDRVCLRCEGALHAIHAGFRELNVRLRCSRCNTDEGVHARSIFEGFRTPLLKLAELIRHFEFGLTTTQAAKESSVSRKVVSSFYKVIRGRLQDYMEAHPVNYGPGDIVEVDELYVAALRKVDRRSGEQIGWPPIIGCIARSSGVVALRICLSHATADIEEFLLSHLPSPLTTVITDGHASFNFLDDYVNHVWCQKIHVGSHVIPITRYETAVNVGTFLVHTNTIEGYWAQVRLRLHESHGWQAEYLPLILYELEFRSLQIGLAVALQV